MMSPNLSIASFLIEIEREFILATLKKKTRIYVYVYINDDDIIEIIVLGELL